MNRRATVVDTGLNPRVKNNDIPSGKTAAAQGFWGVRERAYAVSNPYNLDIFNGDIVEIYLPGGRTVCSAAITFLLPLALFPGGFFLARRFILRAAVDDGVAFLVGLGALLAGVFLGALISRLIVRGGMVPKIIRVLSSSEAASWRCQAAGKCGSCTFCG